MDVWPRKILLAADGSEDAEFAAATAVGLAKVARSELHVINVGVVAPALLKPLDVEPARVKQEARRILDEGQKKVANLGSTVTQSHVRMGNAAKEIVDLAEEIGADLIAVGSRGRGRIKRSLVGSVSDSIVRHAHCPVMVVRWKPVIFPARVLLATDGSEEATMAATTAADLAQRTGSELHLVSVAPNYPYAYEPYFYEIHLTEEFERFRQGAQEVLDEQVRMVGEAGGTVSQAHLRLGAVDEEIIVLAEEASVDLIVVGSRGLGGMRRALVGSVSDSVVRHAHCPVMVVRGTNEAR